MAECLNFHARILHKTNAYKPNNGEMNITRVVAIDHIDEFVKTYGKTHSTA